MTMQYTLDHYFAIEQRSEERHEYFAGRITVVPGASLVQATITVNVAALFHDALGNPVVLVQVLSDLYRSIPTLRDYLLFEQSRVEVEHRSVAGAEWTSRTISSPDAKVRLTGVDIELPLALVYERLSL